MESRAIQNVMLAEANHRAGRVPDYEMVLEQTYRKLIKPGDVVIDVGAHSGRHSAVFSELVGDTGHIHAFEPLPVAQEWFLSRGLPNVTLHRFAISTKVGRTSFVYAEGCPEESGLLEKTFNFPDRVTPVQIEVETRPLDDFDLSNVAFIKIDAEGAEVACLNSATNTISACRPWITVEYGANGYSAFGLTAESLFATAVSLGYVVGDLYGGVCEDVKTWRQLCDRAYWDWYLIPIERVDEWVSAQSA